MTSILRVARSRLIHRSAEPTAETASANRARPLVYRINAERGGRWLLRRPGSSLEHLFTSGRDAEEFVRSDCGRADATIELSTNGVYAITAQIGRDESPVFQDPRSRHAPRWDRAFAWRRSHWFRMHSPWR